MLVLTAPFVQDPREDGFVFTIPGELLYRPFICDIGHDGDCDCARSWAGMSSAKATTIGLVADSPINQDEYVDTIASYLVDKWGWSRPGAEDEAHVLAGIAADYEPGTLLTLRLNGDSHTIEEIEA